MKEISNLFLVLSQVLPESPNKPQYKYNHRAILQLYELLINKPKDLQESDYSSFVFLEASRLLYDRVDDENDIKIIENKLEHFAKVLGHVNTDFRVLNMHIDDCYINLKVSQYEIEETVQEKYYS